jgi:hypothetical protein
VKRMIKYLGLTKDRVMIEIFPVDVTADVRSHPFESLTFEKVFARDVLKLSKDTMEVCFPLKDSFALPQFLVNSVDEWLTEHSEKKGDTVYVTGTADGTGISESADVAWERAMIFKKRLIRNGWNEDLIKIQTGQRDLSNPIRNRCVMMYFE